MNFKTLSLTAFLTLAASVVAKNNHHTVYHQDNANWCEDNQWDHWCSFAAPPGANVLESSCTKGHGKNANTTSVVYCAIGNLDIPGQITLVTGFVTTMAGATAAHGGPPNDVC